MLRPKYLKNNGMTTRGHRSWLVAEGGTHYATNIRTREDGASQWSKRELTKNRLNN